MATTGYSIGVETNDVQLSYIDEAAWGVLPASAFKALRFTGESLASNKARQRVQEIDGTRQASDMVTTRFSAGGTINGAMSIGTYDDLFESLFCADFTTDILENGGTFQSIYLQKRLSPALFLRYPGSFVTGCSLSAALGGFVTTAFTVASQTESKSITDASTGAITAAPSGKVINTVDMTQLVQVAGASPGTVESLSLDITNDGATSLFGLGSATAAGMLMGTFMVSGRVRVYFNSFALYDRYAAETEGTFSFKLVDGTKSYLFEVLNSVLMNPQIVAGGPGAAVLAEYTLEGRRDPVTNKTLRITRDLT